MRFPRLMPFVVVLFIFDSVANAQDKVDVTPGSPAGSSPADQGKPSNSTTDDEVMKFFKLSRDVQILKAENLLAKDPENRDAVRRLEIAMKLPREPMPLEASDVGKVGYWPEEKVETLRAGFGSRLASLHPDGFYYEAIVDWGVPEVPGNRLLIVTGFKTIVTVRAITVNNVVQGVVTTNTTNHVERYDVPVVESLNVKKATRALQKELAKLEKAKAAAE